MIKAKQPANRPPPRIVIAKLKNALALPAGWVPYRRSRTPPCTISTERVVRDPMPNHQKNVLTSFHPRLQPGSTSTATAARSLLAI